MSLVLAVGAAPVTPPIPGMDRHNVISGNSLSEKGITIGGKKSLSWEAD